MRRGAPLRFLAGSIGGWIALRLAVTMLPSSFSQPLAEPPMPRRDVAGVRVLALAAPPEMASPAPRTLPVVPAAPRRAPALRASPRLASRAVAPPGLLAPPATATAKPLFPGEPPVPDATLAVLAPVPHEAAARRWSGSAWLFVRGDGARGTLAPGGQIGGGQAGARVTYRLGDHLALAARISSPTADRDGAEAATGIDWLPFGRRVALRASIERRFAIGAGARDAWSAYAAGGFYRAIGATLVVDGYAQAGVVGTRRRDPFADGAVRAGAHLPLSATTALTLGAGVWGAAQPHAARLDIGPRAALALPLGAVAATLALDARIRVAGAARPGTGLALTLAADF